MIKANELRIGNLVLDSNKDNPYFHQVVRIETKEYTDWNSGDEFNIVCLLEGTKDSYFEMIPSPIPLTEDWLVKFGFVNNSISIYGIDKTLNVSAVVDGNYYLYLDDVFGSFYDLNSIQYVHQLQNLYFALTGEELKQKRK